MASLHRRLYRQLLRAARQADERPLVKALCCPHLSPDVSQQTVEEFVANFGGRHTYVPGPYGTFSDRIRERWRASEGGLDTAFGALRVLSNAAVMEQQSSSPDVDPDVDLAAGAVKSDLELAHLSSTSDLEALMNDESCGVVLASHPTLTAPFQQATIAMVTDWRSPRPMGVVTNNPLTANVHSWTTLSASARETFGNQVLHWGGPVGQSLSVIHSCPTVDERFRHHLLQRYEQEQNQEPPDDWNEMAKTFPGGLFWNNITFFAHQWFRFALASVENGESRSTDYTFFAGECGWSPIQFQKEVLTRGGWIPVRVTGPSPIRSPVMGQAVTPLPIQQPSGEAGRIAWAGVLAALGDEYRDMSRLLKEPSLP